MKEKDLIKLVDALIIASWREGRMVCGEGISISQLVITPNRLPFAVIQAREELLKLVGGGNTMSETQTPTDRFFRKACWNCYHHNRCGDEGESRLCQGLPIDADMDEWCYDWRVMTVHGHDWYNYDTMKVVKAE